MKDVLVVLAVAVAGAIGYLIAGGEGRCVGDPHRRHQRYSVLDPVADPSRPIGVALRGHLPQTFPHPLFHHRPGGAGFRELRPPTDLNRVTEVGEHLAPVGWDSMEPIG